MTTTLILAALLASGLLVMLFFTALADAALRAINQLRLRSLLDQGVRSAATVDRLLDRPHRITTTTLIVNTLVLAALAGLVTVIALEAAPPEGSERALVAGAILLGGIAIIAFVQLIPRSLALRNPEGIAVRLTGLLRTLSAVVGPIAWAAERLANAVLRTFGVREAPRNPFITEEDLRMFVTAGEQEGVIEEEEREMISGVLRFGDSAAHEVMVPRPDVVAVSTETTPQEALEVALQAGHSRVPIYEESIDAIKGVLYTKDLIVTVIREPQRPLVEVARPALFVPETKRLAELLRELRAERVHLAVVVDEYGGTAGIVTIEDLLEEIVGEIHDEYDVEQPDVERVSEAEWIVQGRLALDDVNERLGLALDSADYDTLGGYITAQLGRLPEPGDVAQAGSVRMTVLDVERRRIGRVRVELMPLGSGDDGEAS